MGTTDHKAGVAAVVATAAAAADAPKRDWCTLWTQARELAPGTHERSSDRTG